MKIKNVLCALVAISILAAPSLVLAQGFPGETEGFVGTAKGNTSAAVIDSIVAVLNALLALAGIVAIIFVVIGGVRYLTSQGDEDAVALAKNTIIYALIGLLVIFISAVVVN
ncbi:MAG: hypothetical protein ABIH36_04035, partial [bacterium]